MSPGAAVSLVRMMLQMDVRDILPTIRVPTLVLHKRDDRCIPLEEGKYIADHIPGAKFVELPGADHWPWIGHEEAVEEIQEFLTGMRDGPEPDRAIVTVMFIDIVDSTKRAAELGDRRWADLLESFYAVVRRELEPIPRSRDRHGGRRVLRDVRWTGARHPMCDGARRGRRRLGAPDPHRASTPGSANGWPTRWVVSGSSSGPASERSPDLERSSSRRTVQDLVVGSDLIFEDAGEHELKGVPDRWHLYRVVK